MRAQAPQLVPQSERRPIPERGRATFRLLSAERSDEIYPILMEEVVALGFRRALVVALVLVSGEIKPVAAIHCSQSYLQKFTTALWQGENSIMGVLRSLKPEVGPKPGPSGPPTVRRPSLSRNRKPSWKAPV